MDILSIFLFISALLGVIGVASVTFGIMIMVLRRKADSVKGFKKHIIKIMGLKTAIASIITGIVMLVASVMFIMVGSSFSITISQWNGIASVFDKGECTCELKCFEDELQDETTTYELLYGAEKYAAMLDRLGLDEYEVSVLDTMTGAEASQYLLYTYDKNLFEDWEIAALQDQKVNGRNKNCEVCRGKGGATLYLNCFGSKPYSKDWEWTSVYPDWLVYPEGDTSGKGDSSSNLKNEYPEGYAPGKAEGSYAINMDGGSWYWYHQSSQGDGCHYCGTWSNSLWGGNGSSERLFGRDGCAVYSLAIGISNLIGKEVTPTQVLLDLGCTMSTDSYGQIHWKTSTECFNGVSIYRDKALAKLSAKYGFSYANVGDTVNEWDAILDKNGYIWGSWNDNKCDPWCKDGKRETDAHFMIVRKKAGDKYYCFTSCRGRGTTASGLAGAIQTMMAPMSKQLCVSVVQRPGYQYGIWLDNPSSVWGTPSDVTFDYSGDWYSTVKGNATSSCKQYRSYPSVKIYNGLPWDSNGEATMFDVRAFTRDMVKYINAESTTGDTLKLRVPGTNSEGTLSDLLSTGRLNYGSGKPYYTDSVGAHNNLDGVWTNFLDGVECLQAGVGPAVIFPDYCDGYREGANWMNVSNPGGGAAVGYGKRKVCLVLRDKVYSQSYYLPISLNDAKAHTFPGGGIQTNVSIASKFNTANNTFNVRVAASSGDALGDSGAWPRGTIAKHFNTVKSAGYYPPAYMYSIVECVGWPSNLIKSINKDYDLVGIVVWPANL